MESNTTSPASLSSSASSSSSSSSSSDSVLLRALISRGWRFRDMDKIQGLISAQLSLRGSLCTVDSIESELLNMDLRSIAGKCLPEPSLLRKTSNLQGPMVLQVCSNRDISRSCMAYASGNSGNRRLLRLTLTDGHTEITAVEYSHVPSVPEEVIPGTKVRLQNKVDICSGILCLNNKIITILGGVVQSLNEEWQMKRKYLDASRYALRLSHENASGCPPPFEKLQIRAPVRGTTSILHTTATKGTHCSSDTTGSVFHLKTGPSTSTTGYFCYKICLFEPVTFLCITGFSGSSSNDYGQSLSGKGESSSLNRTVRLQDNNATMDSAMDDVKLLHKVGENKEKPTCSSTRPKVTASVPVQNQAAAQKLLQKTSQPIYYDRNSRSQRQRGKTKEEESPFITLDEWERRKTGIDVPMTHEHFDNRQDEDLARLLQKQFDLEDIHAQKDSDVLEAKSIKMSMFNFEREDARAVSSTFRRGKGRGTKIRGRGGLQP